MFSISFESGLEKESKQTPRPQKTGLPLNFNLVDKKKATTSQHFRFASKKADLVLSLSPVFECPKQGVLRIELNA